MTALMYYMYYTLFSHNMKYCVALPCAAKTALTYQGINLSEGVLWYVCRINLDLAADPLSPVRGISVL